MLQTRKVLVIRSPHAGRSTELPHALKMLRQANVEVVNVLSIAELDGLPNQGPRWQKEGFEAVIAAGGDGVIGGVITHIAESGMPLGILPLGTANDIARSLKIPLDLHKAAEVISQGRHRDMDIGVARPAQQAPKKTQQASKYDDATYIDSKKHGYFAHALTAGINVDFARLATNVATRKRFGRLTYPISAFQVLREHTALNMELIFEGLTMSQTDPQAPPVIFEQPVALRCETLQATAINAPIFGGRWEFTIPGATIEDHLLDIVVIEDFIKQTNMGATFNHLFTPANQVLFDPTNWHVDYPELQGAELSWLPGIHHVRAKSVQIITEKDPQDLTLDGEVRGKTPGRAQIADERLHVFVP